jgi:hypothetical protein
MASRTRFLIVPEEVLVETFIPQAAVEALDKTVLHGLAWGNVVPFDKAVFLSLEDGV